MNRNQKTILQRRPGGSASSSPNPRGWGDPTSYLVAGLDEVALGHGHRVYPTGQGEAEFGLASRDDLAGGDDGGVSGSVAWLAGWGGGDGRRCGGGDATTAGQRRYQ